MTRISAYTSLQDQFGKEQAQALAEFIESEDKPDFTKLATKDDLNRCATKDDLNRFAGKEDLKDLEIRLLKEIQKSREDLMTRMQWTAFIQIVTTIVAFWSLQTYLTHWTKWPTLTTGSHPANTTPLRKLTTPLIRWSGCIRGKVGWCSKKVIQIRVGEAQEPFKPDSGDATVPLCQLFSFVEADRSICFLLLIQLLLPERKLIPNLA